MGRPNQYGGKGAPQLKVRVDPELATWVEGHGGTEYVRQVLQHARDVEMTAQARKAKTESRQAFFQQVQGFVSGALKDTRTSHAGVVDPGSLGKRLAGELWQLMHEDEK